MKLVLLFFFSVITLTGYTQKPAYTFGGDLGIDTSNNSILVWTSTEWQPLLDTVEINNVRLVYNSFTGEYKYLDMRGACGDWNVDTLTDFIPVNQWVVDTIPDSTRTVWNYGGIFGVRTTYKIDNYKTECDTSFTLLLITTIDTQMVYSLPHIENNVNLLHHYQPESELKETIYTEAVWVMLLHVEKFKVLVNILSRFLI